MARQSFKIDDRPVLMPKVKAGLFPHHVRYTPCSASALLHHIFDRCAFCPQAQVLTPQARVQHSQSGPSPTFHLPSHYPPLQTALTIWPLPHSPNTPCDYFLLDFLPIFQSPTRAPAPQRSLLKLFPFMVTQVLSEFCLTASFLCIVPFIAWLHNRSIADGNQVLKIKALRNFRRLSLSTSFIRSKNTKPE